MGLGNSDNYNAERQAFDLREITNDNHDSLLTCKPEKKHFELRTTPYPLNSAYVEINALQKHILDRAQGDVVFRSQWVTTDIKKTFKPIPAPRKPRNPPVTAGPLYLSQLKTRATEFNIDLAFLNNLHPTTTGNTAAGNISFAQLKQEADNEELGSEEEGREEKKTKVLITTANDETQKLMRALMGKAKSADQDAVAMALSRKVDADNRIQAVLFIEHLRDVVQYPNHFLPERKRKFEYAGGLDDDDEPADGDEESWSDFDAKDTAHDKAMKAKYGPHKPFKVKNKASSTVAFTKKPGAPTKKSGPSAKKLDVKSEKALVPAADTAQPTEKKKPQRERRASDAAVEHMITKKDHEDWEVAYQILGHHAMDPWQKHKLGLRYGKSKATPASSTEVTNDAATTGTAEVEAEKKEVLVGKDDMETAKDEGVVGVENGGTAKDTTGGDVVGTLEKADSPMVDFEMDQV